MNASHRDAREMCYIIFLQLLLIPLQVETWTSGIGFTTTAHLLLHTRCQSLLNSDLEVRFGNPLNPIYWSYFYPTGRFVSVESSSFASSDGCKGKNVTDFIGHIPGQRFIFTADPENIKVKKHIYPPSHWTLFPRRFWVAVDVNRLTGTKLGYFSYAVQ